MEKKKFGYLIQIIFVVILIGIGLWSQRNRVNESRQTAFIMDTFFEIEASGRIPDLDAVIDSAFALARDYEHLLSYYVEGSLISAVNNSRGEKTHIDSTLKEILVKGTYFYQATAGKYDLSIGSLSDLWDISKARIPEEKEIIEALANTGFDRIIVEGDSILIPAGMKLNLGSIAKGYIVDQVIDFLISEGVSEILVNAGGDIRIWGGDGMLIGIQHPQKDHGEVIDKIRIKDQAVVTSGDYERYFEVDGVRYHHIIDALTGYPARQCVSVTAIADDAETADALSTAAFVLSVPDAIKLADALPNGWVIIYHMEDDKLVRSVSSGAEEFLE
ncbi:MAG: FAD:protein FMN transferase [Candidatus Stygibacter australis]|nr:FAD:protein FMN transferase [Candidatus Stygibacter australis]MDP8320805.1 FAD:protein FMN transferase [Candidatus Stygibacter australis]